MTGRKSHKRKNVPVGWNGGWKGDVKTEIKRWEASCMSQIDDQHPDDGSALKSIITAVVLIAAGLGLMAWDNYQDRPHPTKITVNMAD